MAEEKKSRSEENLAVGDTPNGNPPFLIYKKRLYVIAKEGPSIGGRNTGDRSRIPEAVEVYSRRQAARHGRPGAASRQLVRRRLVARRSRPYIKGSYRVYSSRYPHLAPSPDRRRARKRLPRTLE